MKERPYTEFYARLLGGFSLSCNDQEISFKGNLRSKYLQLMLMLLHAGDDGISRERLMNQMSGEAMGRDKMLNNLRQQIFVLRKTLASAGLPKGEYIICQKDRYYFCRGHTLVTDTGQIDALYKEIRAGTAKGEERIERLREICRIYSGEFLPMLNGEEWAVVEGAHYQNIYFNCLKELCDQLKEQRAYEEVLELCSKASELHPYDEWQKLQIDCLMAKNRYTEALKVYEKATEVFYEEFGVSPFETVMAKYRSSQGQLLYAKGAITDIKNALMANDDFDGVYYCNYPSFLDIYHLMARMTERKIVKISLLVCTLKVPDEAELSDEASSQMKLLEQILRDNLRRSDVYTRYSPNQFLVLLIGAGAESGQWVVTRLERCWKARRGAGTAEFLIEELENPRDLTQRPDAREAV